MKKRSCGFLLATAALAAVSTIAQDINAAPQAPAPAATLARGVYLESADGATDQVAGAMPIDSRATGTMGAMFGKRPGIVLTIAGATSERKLTTPTPQFRIVLTPYKMPRTPEEMMEHGMNPGAPPPTVKQPKDFVLAKLAVIEGNRELDAKKAVRVSLTSEKVSDNVYRLRPASPLEPGEYALYAVASGQPASVLWDFTIASSTN